MAMIEVPSDEQVVKVLQALGEHVTARLLCAALIQAGYPVRQSQLAIQRASERGRIHVHSDWTLSVAREAVAA